MKKTELLHLLESERERFLDAIDGLSEEEMIHPGVCGEWSLKDLLSHLSRWEGETILMLWQIGQGAKPTTAHFTQKHVDETNRKWFEEARDRSLEHVLADFHAVRNQIALRLEDFTEKDLNDPRRYNGFKGVPLWEWIANNSYEHEAEHIQDVLNWRKIKS